MKSTIRKHTKRVVQLTSEISETSKSKVMSFLAAEAYSLSFKWAKAVHK